ncbi:MAG: hypothetical protein ACYTFV_18170, partial [Planctomycetota bacterium]
MIRVLGRRRRGIEEGHGALLRRHTRRDTADLGRREVHRRLDQDDVRRQVEDGLGRQGSSQRGELE